MRLGAAEDGLLRVRYPQRFDELGKVFVVLAVVAVGEVALNVFLGVRKGDDDAPVFALLGVRHRREDEAVCIDVLRG